MANKKISELAALALLADDDVLPIDDISATETKKVSIATLKTVLSAWRAINATVATIASNITLDVNVGVYKVDTAAPRSLTLYAPGTATGKLPFLLIGDGSDVNAITLVRAGSEKIDNVAASRVLSAKYGRWLVYTDGTDWFTLDVSSGLTAADVLAALAAATSAVNVNGQKIANVSDPGSAQDAATKAYVDAVAQGLSAKKSVRVATTAAGTLATSFENGDTIDGVVLATGDRILIKNQAAGGENGVYTVNASGAPTRATDFDTAAKIEVGAYFFVEEGTANANSGWVLTTDGTIVVGTTALAFEQFSGAGQITAGAGLTKTGNTLDVAAHADGSIIVAADSVQVGVLASDAQHGVRGGGTQHAIATASANGFMAADDYDLLYEQNRVVQIDEEFDKPITSFTESLDAAATFVGLLDGAEPGCVGVYQAKLNTTAGAAVTLYTPRALGTVGDGELRVYGRFRAPTLPDGTENFIYGIGIGSVASFAATHGAWLLFDRSVSTTNWLSRCRNGGTTTTNDTGVAAVTSHKRLEVIVNADRTSVAFKIGGTSITPITTNIPPGSTSLYVMFRVERVAGSTDRQVNVDKLGLIRKFATSRAA